MTTKPKKNVRPIGLSTKELIKTQLQRLPKPVKAVRETGDRLLEAMLTDFFSKIDDQLFELAKNSLSQADQDDFFSAMREIRCKKAEVKTAFFDKIDHAYAALNQTKSADAQINIQNEISASELTLVGFDDLEELMAKESLIRRATETNKRSLRDLAERISSITMADLDEHTLPTSPAILTHIFVESVHTIDISTKAIMVFFKVFEAEVLKKLSPLYQQQNAILIARGILPQTRVSHSLHQQKPPLKQPQLQPQVYVKGIELPLDPEFDAGFFGVSYTAPEMSAAATRSRLLTEGSLPNHPVNSVSDSRNSARTHIPLSQYHQNSPMGLSTLSTRPNSDFTDIMDNLFDNLRNYFPSTQPASSLVEQLRSPLMNIVRQDPSFLENPNHSARTLINRVTEALIYCEDQTPEQLARDPLFQKIEQIIQYIGSLTAPQETDFQRVLNDLDNFNQIEQQRTNLFEKRLYSAELGRLKNQEACNLIRQTITEVCQNMSILPAVQDIIHRGWKQVMTFVVLKFGQHSRYWDDCIQTLIDLVLCTQDFATTRESQDTRHSIIDVKNRLRLGFESIHFNAFILDELFQRLDQTIEGLSNKLNNNEPQQTPAKIQAEISVEKIMGSLDRVVQENPPEQDLTLQPYISQARNFSRGTWFNLKVEDEWVRCRLAAIIEDYDNYIFVNRIGKKVIDLTLQQLSGKLKEQELKPLDNNHLFDSALEQVIHGIQKDRKVK